jgi:hypothetical protein
MNGDDMTDEQKNKAQDVLDALLRDVYSRGVADATSEYEDIIENLKEQNELMLSILKDIDTQIKVGYDVYNILTPETISDISSIITDIEEQKEEENQ